MKSSNIKERLKALMSERNLRQIDIIELCKPFCEKYKVRLGRNDLNQYLSGKASPRQDKLTILGLALNVSEVWLMGYDVLPTRPTQEAGYLIQPLPPACPLLGACTASAKHLAAIFLQLDEVDKARVIERAEALSLADKYKKLVSTDNDGG